MKANNKLIIAALTVLVPLMGQAQKPFYHNTGDTLDYLDTIYWRPAWYDRYVRPDTITAQAPDPVLISFYPGEFLMKCYTDKPLQVIGIASSIKSYSGADSNRRQEYLRLYQAHPNDSLELKIELPYNLNDPHRTIDIQYRRVPSLFACDSLEIHKRYAPIYECHTNEKPITITGDFYIGGTNYSIGDENSYATYENYPEYWGADWDEYETNTPCHFPIVTYRFTNFYDQYDYFVGDLVMKANTVQIKDKRILMYTFPILLIDTSFADTSGGDTYVCPEVKRLRAANTWESGGVMLWDAEVQHCMWQLRLCNAGGDVENPLIDTLVHTAYHTFGGLQPETHYDVYIRAYCEHYGDTLESDWSGPVDLYTVFQNTAIDQPSDALVQLMPNPAGDHVQVVSCFPLRSVELYDLQGKPVLSQQAEGASTVLDVSRLSRGTYIAVIRNQGGTSTKKLILN